MSDMTETKAPASPTLASSIETRSRRWRTLRRIVLMASLPLALAAGGGWYWVHGGRYISTENAYVKQDQISLSAEISGRISSVMVKQNQSVKPGDLLFTIDGEAYKIAAEKAESAVATARLQVGQLRAAYDAAKVKVETAKVNLAFYHSSADRQKQLRQDEVATQSDLEKSQHDVDAAEQALAEARQNLETALAALGGNPDIKTDDHPLVQAALASLDQAKLDLAHTQVTSPVDGIAAQVSALHVGSYVSSGQPIVALVATRNSWVEANFNETDLEYMKPGQKAVLKVDSYPDAELKAEVDSIGAGTGSTFSLLPAQNATGNWVKVVQRVPVRLKLTGDNPALDLRAGLSVAVTVDTGHIRALPAVITRPLEMAGLISEAKANDQH